MNKTDYLNMLGVDMFKEIFLLVVSLKFGSPSNDLRDCHEVHYYPINECHSDSTFKTELDLNRKIISK